MSAPLNTARRSTDLAAGVRIQPMPSLPVAITLERRQSFGKGGSISGFAAVAESGLYRQPLFGRAIFDGYVQGGIVGVRERLWFVDGGGAVTHPLWRNMSGGVGIWGAAQPGLHRLEAGPRLTLDMGRGMRIHADYRAKLVGNAMPESGAVMTLAADF